MAFTETTHSTTFYAQMYDPAKPERGFGAFVNRVTVKEYEDGTRVVEPEVQKDMAVAVKEGITLPSVLAEFNMISAARVVELEAIVKVEDDEKAALKSQVERMTAQIVELREVLIETAQALRDATNGAEVARVDASLMSSADAIATVDAIKADNNKSIWNPLSWFR
jgi:hypothetical protein